jgi:hypothetical protein
MRAGVSHTQVRRMVRANSWRTWGTVKAGAPFFPRRVSRIRNHAVTKDSVM